LSGFSNLTRPENEAKRHFWLNGKDSVEVRNGIRLAWIGCTGWPRKLFGLFSCYHQLDTEPLLSIHLQIVYIGIGYQDILGYLRKSWLFSKNNPQKSLIPGCGACIIST
jgi:hypothetical protein